MKEFIVNLVSIVDYYCALILTLFLSVNKKNPKAIIIPADSITGGFGEDIMIAGFAKLYGKPFTIGASKIGERSYLTDSISKEICFNGHLQFIKFAFLLQRYSDIYIIGADILDGVYAINKHRFRLLNIAHHIGLKTHITGFSIRSNPSEYFIKKIRIESCFTKIKARDFFSYERLVPILGKDKVEETVDIAFACDYQKDYKLPLYVRHWIKLQKEKGKKIIAFCPNTIHAKKIGLEPYIESQIKLLKQFEQNKCSILFLYHDLRKYALNINDLELSKKISDYFKDNGLFVPNIPDGVTMKSYIKECDFTVTGRMHFGISGYTFGMPMFGICYYNKFEGVQRLFNIPIQSSLIEFSDVEKELYKVQDFIRNLHTFQNEIIHNLLSVKKIAHKNI